MVNRCKYLNIILCICGISGFNCQYMSDPMSCTNYDEDTDRLYVDIYKDKDLTDIAQLESERIDMEVESFGDFATRAEEHLHSIGVETERESKTEDVPDWF